MKISSKGRYAVRIMTEIAKNTDKCVSVSDIASSQNLSIKYTEQIINKLVKNKLLESFRGSLGGYKLCKPAQDHTSGKKT
ncbi:MAG: Rrf2 family transcriptional regulator [Firmicutes bacterium]|nr:Rrf2 family transcriptional regulator [Bacillota bacterium]